MDTPRPSTDSHVARHERDQLKILMIRLFFLSLTIIIRVHENTGCGKRRERTFQPGKRTESDMITCGQCNSLSGPVCSTTYQSFPADIVSLTPPNMAACKWRVMNLPTYRMAQKSVNWLAKCTRKYVRNFYITEFTGALCYKPEDREFETRMWWIFFKFNSSSRIMVLGSTQLLRTISTGNLPGGNKRPQRRADNLAAICEPNVYKGGSHNLSEP
jgi:hypothetical protein